MAKRIFRISERKNGGIIKAIAWEVEKSNYFPEGIKYSFVYLVNNRRVIGYDNERAKRHHRHFLNKDGILAEEQIVFISVEETAKSFYRDVEEFRKRAKDK